MGGTSLPDKVANLYYTYGLFASSHPATVITIAITSVMLCCYPLLNVPLPGNIPTLVTLPYEANNNSSFENKAYITEGLKKEELKHQRSGNSNVSLVKILNDTENLPYVWKKDKSLVFVQQIIMKAGVSPWSESLYLWDAFRAPLQEVFKLLEVVRNYEDPKTGKTLTNLCLHVENIKRKNYKEKSGVLPEYNCLVLSPANMWQQNLQHYAMDSSILSTILSHQSIQKGKVSVAEMLFGMQLKDAGIKRYPFRSRPRTIQYAITLFLEEIDEDFLTSLSSKLISTYPLYQDEENISDNIEILLVYYPGKFNYHELIPLIISIIGLFVYVYFSLRKTENVKSKIGLAFCAVLTIVASLSMSAGLCFIFGLTLSLQGKEIFPYLVILVGLENVLVLTKSVISTDTKLDVKIRLAQGLRKEGWSITKNLLTEITILTIGLFTFVPVIQEFSLFMIISLISDFFVQIMFYSTILGIDIRRMGYCQDKNSRLQLNEYFNTSMPLSPQYSESYIGSSDDTQNIPRRMLRSKSHPRLSGSSYHGSTEIIATHRGRNANTPEKYVKKLPKRIRLVNVWARTRFFQRAFMFWMVVWISMIVYNSGVIEQFLDKTETTSEKNSYTPNAAIPSDIYEDKQEHEGDVVDSPDLPELTLDNIDILTKHDPIDNTYNPLLNVPISDQNTTESILLRHVHHLQPWKRLSIYHWNTILSQYNITVAGKYITILPPLLLSCRISPETAINSRNPEEKEPVPLRWQALAAALDPLDFTDFDTRQNKQSQVTGWGKMGSSSDFPIYPRTPMEILLLAVLCAISLLVITYTVVVLYRCVCTRNYAEWRASWSEREEDMKENLFRQQPALQLVMEAVTLAVPGHEHEIECLVSDGESIVSSCLRGTLKVWNAANGDLISQIDRDIDFGTNANCEIIRKESNSEKENSSVNMKQYDTPLQNYYKNTQTKIIPEHVPVLKKTLDEQLTYGGKALKSETWHFRETNYNPVNTIETSKYEFAKHYKNLYSNSEKFEIHQTEIRNKRLEGKNMEKENLKPTEVKNLNAQQVKINLIPKDGLSKQGVVMSYKTRRKKSENTSNISIDGTSGDISENQMDKTPKVIPWNSNITYSNLPPPVWCLDTSNNLIVLGCANGQLELWEANTGKFLCVYDEGASIGASSDAGVTHVRLLGAASRVCIARLSGYVEMFSLEVFHSAGRKPVDWGFSAAYRRTHIRTGSAGSISTPVRSEVNSYGFSLTDEEFARKDMNNHSISNTDNSVRCLRITMTRAHQQPVTILLSESCRIVSGGQDHILKIFSYLDLKVLYTLHGHCGPITSCFIDRTTPTIGGSGSQDGLLCVWDLHTGACLYSIHAHDGAVSSLACSASYVMSTGSDEKLCIWDRFQGHLLNTVHIGLSYCCGMLPLTHSLLVIGDKNGLTVWDVSTGDVVRRVVFDVNHGCVFIRQVLPLKDAIVCDYGNQLRIVRFPLVSKLTSERGIKNE